MTAWFYLFIFLIKAVGMKLVWTVHDVLPHENYFLNNSNVMKFLAASADRKIVHSNQTTKLMASLGFNTKSTSCVPIGSYGSLYKNTISKRKSLSILGLKYTDFVFGMFGKIEEYKNPLQLIMAFKNANIDNSALCIAGQCPNSELKEKMETAAGADTRIKLHLEFIDDDNVQMYLNAMDVLVYPFSDITTSSSVLLAMAFGKPVICPSIGDMRDYPDNTGYYYFPNNFQNLVLMMKHVVRNQKEAKDRGKTAKNFSLSQSWDKAARLTKEIYSSLL